MKVFLLRCSRCCAAFVVVNAEERYGAHPKKELLEASPCVVCSKGEVELVGELHVKAR